MIPLSASVLFAIPVAGRVFSDVQPALDSYPDVGSSPCAEPSAAALSVPSPIRRLGGRSRDAIVAGFVAEVSVRSLRFSDGRLIDLCLRPAVVPAGTTIVSGMLLIVRGALRSGPSDAVEAREIDARVPFDGSR